ncbi:hypothetical protein ACTJ5T_08535 [Streptococcus suis]|uniref:hypothetical protein n=1 Tax=Streptococcus suis TaxID=1307 RepID=UPI003F8C09AF
MFLIGGKRIKEDELDYIRHLYQYPENSTVKSVTGHLGISRRAYYYRREKAGITKKHIRGWSDEEIVFIKKTCNTLTTQEQADMLGRTVSAVKNKRFEIGAVRYHSKPRLEEVRKLASAGLTRREISKALGISTGGVDWYLYQYGIDFVKCDGSHVWRNDMKTLFGENK